LCCDYPYQLVAETVLARFAKVDLDCVEGIAYLLGDGAWDVGFCGLVLHCILLSEIKATKNRLCRGAT
jgi:hypothetical protein